MHHRGSLTPKIFLYDKMFGQVIDDQEGGCLLGLPSREVRCCRSLAHALHSVLAHNRTSMAWRKPSLMRLKLIEVIKIITPGRAAMIGLTHNAWRRLFNIKPHSASGGVTPSPRKLSPAARIIEIENRLVV